MDGAGDDDDDDDADADAETIPYGMRMKFSSHVTMRMKKDVEDCGP